MKRILILMLALLLCWALVPLAQAEDGTLDAVTSFQYILKEGSTAYVEEAPEAFGGKSIIAVCDSLEEPPVELSTQGLKEEGRYWSIPAEFLAESIDEADWVLLVYPTYTGNPEAPVVSTVFAVDVKKIAFYAPYTVEDRPTVLENEWRNYDIDSTLRGIEEFIFFARWRAENPNADDPDYQQGLAYFAEGKYFSARECFLDSRAEDAAERAAACVQPWPKNGEIWRDASVKKGNVELTVRVNQAADTAAFFRIYKSGQPASYLFISGTGKATIKLPSGTYSIKEGTGKTWYGPKEAFGRSGSYEIMTFDDAGSEEVTLRANRAYTITINVQESNPDADSIGSERETWDNFAE